MEIHILINFLEKWHSLLAKLIGFDHVDVMLSNLEKKKSLLINTLLLFLLSV